MRSFILKDGEKPMAEHHESAMDYTEHERTYALFLGMVKYGSVAVILILVLMALFLL